MHHALIGVDAREQDRFDSKVAQDAVERRVPETADAILVDLDVVGFLRQFVEIGSKPVALLAWGPACYALKDRVRWISWTAPQRIARLKFFAARGSLFNGALAALLRAVGQITAADMLA